MEAHDAVRPDSWPSNSSSHGKFDKAGKELRVARWTFLLFAVLSAPIFSLLELTRIGRPLKWAKALP